MMNCMAGIILLFLKHASAAGVEACFRTKRSSTTLLICLSCSDKLDENLQAVLEHVYLLFPEVIEGFEEYSARVSIGNAHREGCYLKERDRAQENTNRTTKGGAAPTGGSWMFQLCHEVLFIFVRSTAPYIKVYLL